MIPDDSAEIDTEATILVNGNDAAHPSSHNNDSTVVIGVTEPGASAQSTNSASNSNTNKNDGIYHWSANWILKLLNLNIQNHF